MWITRCCCFRARLLLRAGPEASLAAEDHTDIESVVVASAMIEVGYSGAESSGRVSNIDSDHCPAIAGKNAVTCTHFEEDDT